MLKKIISRSHKFLSVIMKRLENRLENSIRNKRYISFMKNTQEILNPNVPEIKNRNINNNFSPINFEYKDETWNKIKNRFIDRRKVFWGMTPKTIDNSCRNDKITFNSNEILFRSKNINDDWIYLIDNRQITNFSLKFIAKFNSKFREIQFAFRHVDFYNRYRFRLEDGHIHFDIIHKGKFYNSIFKKTFQVEVDKSYNFNIIIADNMYYFLVDGKTKLALKEIKPVLKNGTYALILWDPREKSDINADYTELQLIY